MGSVARGAVRRDPSRLLQEVEAIAASAIGFFLALCLLSYVPDSPDVNHGGRLGFSVANVLVQCFGLAAYVFPASLVSAGVSLFLSRAVRMTLVRCVGAALLLLLVSVALGVYRPHVAPEAAGGAVGGFLGMVLVQGLGSGGSAVVLVALFLLDFMMITGHALSEVIRALATAIDDGIEAARQALVASLRRGGQGLEAALPSLRKLGSMLRAPSLPLPGLRGGAAGAEPVVVYGGDDEDGGGRTPSRGGGAGPTIERPRLERPGAKKKPEPAQEEFVFSMNGGDFRLPPTTLLGKHDDRSDYVDEPRLVQDSKILEQKLATFGVGGRVTAVRPGPVITTYEFEPEAGIKVSRVVNLCDDLTMALRAHGVRIVAPIPGKNCVGIEVSNKNRAVVGLRDLIEADDFRGHKSAMALALGRDTTGNTVYADLGRMPHLLMAGATGTGKSVALNTYIVSILYKATPHDVRFIMIDPKMLELSLYEGIPHLLVPVVTDVKKAAAALANVMREMDRRFELMKDKKVRSLDDYNKRIAEEEAVAAAQAKSAKGWGKVLAVAAEEEGDEEDGETAADEAALPGLVHEHLPRIVVIIDELADLMMTVGREVESAVTRLAQKARAAGIHLIVATQRPSVDVITGLIKANFPSRISFQVTSRPDSRTILDTVGADRLLGNGDLLYMAPGTSHLQRLHGGLVTDQEIKEIVEFLRRQGAPDYRMEILEVGGGGEDGDEGEDFFDELYDRSVELVTQHGQGSTSWLQRKLGIGYNRAARIMEQMEREGVVGPGDGAKPRKVLAQAL
ncbi:MAG: DNA translocase FtsK 4TM domain-containing protein [Deltaproteobacteria bacterium]|nr:DNA translocase FtsK 4TM domain-containing protein [Deltaproteobacteria bacterium]